MACTMVKRGHVKRDQRMSAVTVTKFVTCRPCGIAEVLCGAVHKIVITIQKLAD